jgi:hypothetical protein
MITRAQAEALLTLAESLEACEQNEVNLCPGNGVVELFYGQRGVWTELRSLSAASLRVEISRLYPKSET